VRQPIVHTLNLAHMMPVSAVWAGPKMNRHLKAPPLIMAETRGSTPFRLDLHVGDVGHAFIVSPTGSGKSVLLSLLALQFRQCFSCSVMCTTCAIFSGLSGLTRGLGGSRRFVNPVSATEH
jgi:type IV secretion system protein VirB4